MEQYATLTDEHWFADLITGAGMPPLLAKLQGAHEEFDSVLDLGCGMGSALIALYYGMGATILHGVDMRTEGQLVKGYNELQPQVNGATVQVNSIAERWWYMTADPKVDRRPRLESIEKCRSLTTGIQLETTIARFQVEPRLYDAVIVSHLLHYLGHSDIDKVFDIIRNNVRPNGLIYFSMKDAYPDGELPGAEVLARCMVFYEEVKARGVVYYPGPKTMKDQGYCHVFTNL